MTTPSNFDQAHGGLYGRTALVTGSSRGIGLGIARRLAQEDVRVVLHGRDHDRLRQAQQQLLSAGATVHTVAGDLENPQAVQQIRSEVIDAIGVPDILIANAGGSDVAPGPIDELEVEDWSKTIAANLTATFLTIRAFVPAMKQRGSGSVVTVSSTAVRIADAQSPPAYSAAKAGIEMMTKTLAVQAGPHGVRANCVAPATILTETNTEAIPPDIQDQIANTYPLRRLGTVNDVAEAVLFLTADTSAWITGTVIDVAGGSSAV